MDPNVKDSIVARLKEATNVLVTVSNNPSVDQLAACIGFTLLLNKVGKRGAAVFSGAVPSTLEFLQPDKTIEKNTDSLRDFIIALDKSKADKLRYKVEDKVVKIFITPYRTSISDKDLDFSQGDFNVDVVIALGVHEKSELDEAIVSHGRILHDATVISVNNKDQGSIGTLNWVDLQASSLSEMMASIGQALGGAEAFDNQIATALMTGIVAETDRFSNEKTSPATMKLASELMGAGANQQLIATKLQEPAAALGDVVTPGESDDGELTIEHTPTESEPSTDDAKDIAETSKSADATPEPELELPEPQDADEAEASEPASKIDNVRTYGTMQNKPTAMTLEPPTMGGKLTANSEPEHLSLDPSTDPLSVGATKSSENGILSRKTSPSLAPLPDVPTEEHKPDQADQPAGDNNDTDKPDAPAVMPPVGVESDEAAAAKPADSSSSPAVPSLAPPSPPLDAPSSEPSPPVPTEPPEVKEEKLEDARDAVEEAIKEGGDPEKNLEPIAALGAQPVNLDLGHEAAAPADANPGFVAPGSTPGMASDEPLSPGPLVPPSPTENPAVNPLEPPVNPTGEVSMPPNPANTPPTPGPSGPMNPPLNTSDFVNPSAPSAPSDASKPLVPPSLVPNGQPTETSGASGPATPPPPVPPPMMPPMPPSAPTNPNQPL